MKADDDNEAREESDAERRFERDLPQILDAAEHDLEQAETNRNR